MGIFIKEEMSTISEYRNIVYHEKPTLLANFEKSLSIAKNYFGIDDEELYGVIIVECYPCITLYTNTYYPFEIARTVFPYDADNVYPMQAIKQEISFMNYRECMSCKEWPPF